LSDFITAFRFLTILPLGKGKTVEPERMAASMAWFPLVGAWLGGALFAVDYLLRLVVPGNVSSVLVIALLALVTGGLHLDGFADTLDGIFGGRGDKARILEIMKDSRIGAIGVVGLVFLLMLKFVSLDGLFGDSRAYALVLMPTLARWSQVCMALGARSARGEGSLAKPFLEHLNGWHLVSASAVTFAVAVLLAGLKGLVVVVPVAAITVAARLYFNRKIGGITGDTIGAVSEVNEVIVLLTFLV